MGARILLVKLSSLGDVVHTLPVVQDILAARPDAQIDWVVEKSFAPVLAPLLLPHAPDGVPRRAALNRVIPCEIRRWRAAPLSAPTRQAWQAFKAQLRHEAYDAVIDLQGLTKSALVSRLARLAPGGQRYALANQTEGSGYEAPTRWVADVAISIALRTPAVQRSRQLAAQALGYRFAPVPDFGLKAIVARSAHSPSVLEKIAMPLAPRRVAFVHGTSRADKQWPQEHWVALGRRLVANGLQIGLPHGNAQELASSQAIARALNREYPSAARVWPLLPLDMLTDEIARCAGVIGVDSGVSHIAVALDLPHVQIYNFDTAWRTGPPGGSGARQVSVYARPTPGVDAVWQAWLACTGSGTGGRVTVAP